MVHSPNAVSRALKFSKFLLTVTIQIGMDMTFNPFVISVSELENHVVNFFGNNTEETVQFLSQRCRNGKYT